MRRSVVFFFCRYFNVNCYILMTSETPFNNMSSDIKPTFSCAIEGNISAGKTTLTKVIGNAIFHTNASFVDSLSKVGSEAGRTLCLIETVPRELLGMMYLDNKKYAYAFQLVMAAKRAYSGALINSVASLTEALIGPDNIHSKTSPAANLVWDRSILGDFIFALTNFSLGNIDKLEFDAYLSVLLHHTGQDQLSLSSSNGVSVSAAGSNGDLDWHMVYQADGIAHLDAIVYLSDTPAACHERMINSRKNAEEKMVSLDYLTRVEDAHFYVLFLGRPEFFKTPLLVYDWDTYSSFGENWLEKVRSEVNAKASSAKDCSPVIWANSDRADYWLEDNFSYINLETLDWITQSRGGADEKCLYFLTDEVTPYLTRTMDISDFFERVVTSPKYNLFKRCVFAAMARRIQVCLV